MKFLVSQITTLMEERETRRNVCALLSYLAVLLATIAVFSGLFHAIMLYEGQNHSWLTGLYWTFTVMSTLGFGDITFQSDLGRGFSIVVLLSGIVMFLIVLPFTFIRFFYAPWLEAQVRLRAPRAAPNDVTGHVILCHYDDIAIGLIPRLEKMGVPYFVLEPDPTAGAELHSDGVSVVTGALDAKETYELLHAERARLVLANLSDAENTNITLTIREVDGSVAIAALAENEDSIDVLELSGASNVIAVKHKLGEHLGSRVAVGTPHALRIGGYADLVIAEFPLHGTTFPGRTIRETRLRELTGLNIVGVWERGKLQPAWPDTVLSKNSVPVIVGTEEQMTELDALFAIYRPNENPVLVIGGGKVGCATAAALRHRDISVTIMEQDPVVAAGLQDAADRVVVGDAANHDKLMEAGLADAPSVILTTNDDATNIFLAIYCRRLNPGLHLVSRINHDRNLEAIHRAGADFVLSYGSLAVKSVLSLIQGRELVIVGEEADLLIEPVPAALEGKSLGESAIGVKTGLSVIALRCNGETITNPSAATKLPAGAELVMLGTAEQHHRFSEELA